MPQMSPMNWLLISTSMIFMFYMIKTSMNKTFESKKLNKNLIKTNKSYMKW